MCWLFTIRFQSKASKTIRGTYFGVRVVEETAVTDPRSGVVGHRYIDQMKTEEDILKIQMPKVSFDLRDLWTIPALKDEVFSFLIKEYLRQV